MSNDQAANLRELMNKTKPEEEESTDGKLYAFVGREGSGNTTIVSNISSLMAKEGKKIIIIDFNSGILTTDIFFNVIPNRNMKDIIDGDRSEKEMLLRARDNVYIVYANKVLDLSKEEKELFRAKVDILRKDADLIFADIEGVENLGKLTFFLKDAESIFVTDTDAESIQETYYGIKYLSTNMDLDSARIIVNKSDSAELSDRIIDKLGKTADKFLGIKVEKIGYICREKEVKDSMRKQKLFTDIYPDLRSTSEIVAVKDRL